MRRETTDERKNDVRQETITMSPDVSCFKSCIRWPRVKLSEVTQGIYDGPHATPPPCETPGYYFLGIPQITSSGHIDLANPRYIAKEDYAKWTKRVVPCEGDVVFSYEATLNLYARIPQGMKCCLGRRMGLVRPNKAKLDSQYLYYYFFSPEWRKIVTEKTVVGATVDRLPIKTFPSFLISLPPLSIQRRIADILSAYDDLIENNRRRIAILEETARLAYRKWFDEVEQNKNATLGDICFESRHGVNPDEIAPDMPYIGLEHMPRRSISLCEWDMVQKVSSTKLSFEAGDILFGKIRPYFHKVGIAFVDGVASSDAIVIKPLRPEWQAYVLMTVSSDSFVATASQGMKEGSKMPRADWKQLLNYPVAIPDKATLSAFNRILMPILEQLKVLCFSIRNLAATRDMLLPRLMKGEMV